MSKDNKVHIIDQIISSSFDMYLSRIEGCIMNTKLVDMHNWIICFEETKNSEGFNLIIAFIIIIYKDANIKKIDYKNISTNTYGSYTPTTYYQSLDLESNFTDKEFKNKTFGFVSRNAANYRMKSKQDFGYLYNTLNCYTLSENW